MVEKIQLAVRMRPEVKEGLHKMFPQDSLPTTFEKLIFAYIQYSKRQLKDHLYGQTGHYAVLEELEAQGISKEFINQVKATGDAMEAKLSMLDEILQDCFATGLESEDEDKEGDFAQPPWVIKKPPWVIKQRRLEREASNA
jgi:hypothetical protein